MVRAAGGIPIAKTNLAQMMFFFECSNPGEVALTFNNGPSEYTEEILDALDEYEWKATFFMTGVPSASNKSTRHALLDDQDSKVSE